MRTKLFTKKKVMIGLLLCLLAGGAVVIQNRQEEVITLELGMFTGSNWDVANANSYVIIDKVIERFERDHENVKVNYVSGIRKEDYSEWLSQKILAGETPDVFMVLTSDFNQFASVGALKNLETLSAADADFDADAYFTTALNSGKYQGVQYAMPYETVPTLMFVNKTLLAREGIEVPDNDWTWDDMLEICRQVTKDTDGDGITDQFGAYNYSWKDAVYSNDGSLFDTDGTKGLFTEKEVLRAVEFTKELNELNDGQKVSQEDFDEGRVAFMPLLFSEYRTYKSYPYKLKKYSSFQWDCITMPAGESGGNVSEVDTLLLGISNNTRQEELA